MQARVLVAAAFSMVFRYKGRCRDSRNQTNFCKLVKISQNHAKSCESAQDRDEQLAFDQKRRDEELAKQEKEEKALVSKIVREMEQEKVRMAAKISKIGRVQL